VVKAFELILSEPNVKAIFVNIFGGIVRCDLIAEGIISAISEVGISIPVVVRLEGNGAEIASKMLADSKLNIIAQNDLALAAQAVVKAIQ
jgi:succinyl-CoA synthetase beta subunit